MRRKTQYLLFYTVKYKLNIQLTQPVFDIVLMRATFRQQQHYNLNGEMLSQRHDGGLR